MGMKKKVLLIQPPIFKSEVGMDVIQEAYWSKLDSQMNKILEENHLSNGVDGYHAIEPNIGLLYVAACLKESGCELQYADFIVVDNEVRKNYGRPINEEDIVENLSKIPEEFLNIVAISSMTSNFKWAKLIAQKVKEINQDAIVMLGGVHGSFEYQNILENVDAIDLITIGEGEITTPVVVEALCENRWKDEILSNVKGIAFRSKEGKVVLTSPREYIADLDTIPYPLYELYSKEVLDNVMIRIITSRGCSNNCSFCVPTKVFNKLRFRSIKCVVDELEYYHRTFGWRLFMIGDLNFLSNYKYSVALCEEIIRRELDISWICQSRVDLINPDIVQLMKKAGCVLICLGIESASQDILDKTNKLTTVEKSIESCKQVKEAGIHLYTYWVFGLPYETHDSAHATVKLLRRLVDEKIVDLTHCTMCVPYPGTDLYKHPEENGIHILSKEYDEFWMGCDYLGAGLPVTETEGLSRYEIYAYWQMALAVVAGNLNEDRNKKED